MGRAIGLVLAIATILLVTVGTLFPARVTTTYIAGAGTSAFQSAETPEAAVRSLLDNVRQRRYAEAYRFLANQQEVEQSAFANDLIGTHGNLRTYSALEPSEVKVLKQSDGEAMVRADLKWATGVGGFYDTRDLKVVKQGSEWKVVWPVRLEPKVPPQVIPVTYLRWDVIQRGGGDDWGAQNVEGPRVRITSMRAVPSADTVVILGEIINEDTIPAWVSVGATLVGQKDEVLGQENSFDKTLHTLLPKEVSPFRIDFPGVQLAQVKSVRMQPNASLVPASADPVIAVLNQRLETNGQGQQVLAGELLNESGQVVNIPHVIATYYNNNGQIVWVEDGYVDRALLPQNPVPFSVQVPENIAKQVQSYRVVVNHYSAGRMN
ncbi:MAG: hypothetical protein AB7O65_00445 [Candidatus Korobacteraceae bacterium]